MTPILNKLAAREEALCTYTGSLTGTLEAKGQQLEATGIFAAYTEIYAEYLATCHTTADEPQKLELLKRLVFLSWYGMLEPSFLTGIGELSEADIRTTFELLDEYVRGQKLDAELHWMLSFYSSWDFLILHFTEPRLTALATFIETVDHTIFHVPKHQLPRHTMDNRGQMGLYWQSMGVEIS